MPDQTVSMRLSMDASEFKKEAQESGKVMDQLSGSSKSAGADIDRVLSGIVGSAGKAEDGIRSLDARLDTLTGADRDVLIRANIAQAEQGIRKIDTMLGDASLDDQDIRVLVDRRNEATKAIENLKEELGELGPEAHAAGDDIERGLDLGALGGAVASAGIADRMGDAVTSSGQLRASLGLTSDEVREFDAVAKEVYRNNFGESMGHAAQVTGMVHQTLGLVEDDLATTVMSLFSVSDAFEHVGADVPVLLQSVRAMTANFPGLKEAEALDLIAHGFQTGAGNAGDLQDTLLEYPGDFARLGLTADDMLGILNAGMEAGVFNTDKMADAVREMGIRVSTAGDTGQLALAKLFPAAEAQRLIQDVTAGGEAGRQAFFTILEGLTAVQDPQDRYNLAIELMGSQGEEIANQLPNMRDALLEVRDGTIDAGGAAESTGAQYTGFRNTLEGVVRYLETSAVGTLGEVGVGALDVASNVGIAALGLKAMGDLLPGQGGKLASFGRAAGIAAGEVTLLYAAGQILNNTLDRLDTADLTELENALLDLGEGGNVGGEAADTLGQDFDKLSAAIEAVAAPSNMTKVQHLANEIGTLGGFLGRGSFGSDQALQTIDDLDQALASLAQRDPDAAAASLDAIRDAIGDEAFDRLVPLLDGYDSALAGIDTASRTAAGGVEVYGDATSDAVEPTQSLAESISAVTDAYRAQFDPLFAAQDALLGHRDAQDQVVGAELRVIEATRLRDEAIRDHGRASEEARVAGLDLMEAERDLDDANRDVVRSALDVTTAQYELKRQLDDGNLSIDQARTTLQSWVEQGLLTEEQARQAAEQLGIVAWNAAAADGINVTIPISLEDQQFWLGMAAARGALAQLQVEAQLANPFRRTSGFQLAAGGLVPNIASDPIYRASGGPSGTDTVAAWLTPGEFVLREPAARALGSDLLYQLNRAETWGTGDVYSGQMAAGGTTIVNHVSVSAGSIVGDHGELVRVVQRGLDEAARLVAA